MPTTRTHQRLHGRMPSSPVLRGDRDHVAALAERVRNDFGHIDVLVNDIWGAEILKGGPPLWNKPIWELDIDDGLRILRLGVDTHLVTADLLLPLLVDEPGGLLVEPPRGRASTRRMRQRRRRCG